MKIRKLYFILLVSFVTLIVSSSVLAFDDLHKNENILGEGSSKDIHIINFYNEQLFYEGIYKSDQNYKNSEFKISGGIIPHDFLPGFMLSDFFKKLSEQKVKTIILIGPNHYEKGSHNFLTSEYDWNTPFGVVNSDNKFINELIEKGLVRVDEEVLPKDHSIGSIFPYIKFYLPDAEVVPILVSAFTTQDKAFKFSENLSVLADEETVVIAAVDFSHYLSSSEAYEKDKVMLELLEKRDHERIFSLNNDYTDSPVSLVILLETMENLDKKNMELIHNTNSGILQNNEHIETTSYFSIAFFE